MRFFKTCNIVLTLALWFFEIVPFPTLLSAAEAIKKDGLKNDLFSLIFFINFIRYVLHVVTIVIRDMLLIGLTGIQLYALL